MNTASVETCAVEIPHITILKLIEDDADILRKYHRFKFQKDFPNGRECPYCFHLQIGSSENVIITCEKCDKKYCFLHSDAHPIGSNFCELFIKSESANEEYIKSSEYIKKTAKTCPGCQMFVTKSGGCNHMKVTKLSK